MTISILCGSANLVLSPCRVWADRYNRKKLIIFSDSFIAVSTLIVAVVFLLGYEAFGCSMPSWSLGHRIRPVTCHRGNSSSNGPGGQATRVNAVNGSLQSFINLISPMVSGALLTLQKLKYILYRCGYSSHCRFYSAVFPEHSCPCKGLCQADRPGFTI